MPVQGPVLIPRSFALLWKTGCLTWFASPFIILPGLSVPLGDTLFRWYLLVLSQGIWLDFVIACCISSWNFVVMHGSAQRELPTSLTWVLLGVSVTEAKLHGTEAVLSSSSVKQFMGSEPEGHGFSPVVTSWALLLFVPEQELERA